MSQQGASSLRAVSSLGTTLSRARCARPAQLERMKQSLSAQGQLTPMVAVERDGRLEIIDGFKRLWAAKTLSWPEVSVRAMDLDERSQWTAMLAFNRGPQSMTVLEEGLVLRELCGSGLTQVEIGQLVHRHQSWVSRRVGLITQLHPELLEAMKLGLLAPGVARRLLPLPAGNQLEMAAAAQAAKLMPRDMERLVSLWQRTPDPDVRRWLLSEPREALSHFYPEEQPEPLDPRLTAHGQKLRRLLRLIQGAATRAVALLKPSPPEADQTILAEDLKATAQGVGRLASALGSIESSRSAAATERSGATS